MKIKDLLYTYKNKLDELEKVAKDYYDKHYCGYMGEWVSGSQAEFDKLRQDVKDYLDSRGRIMNIKELNRLIDLLKKFQYEIEDEIDKEGGRILGRAKDYCRIELARREGRL